MKIARVRRRFRILKIFFKVGGKSVRLELMLLQRRAYCMHAPQRRQTCRRAMIRIQYRKSLMHIEFGEVGGKFVDGERSPKFFDRRPCILYARLAGDDLGDVGDVV